MQHPVFLYGTLMIPQVMDAVSGTVYSSRPADLPGYRRVLIRDEVYPAIVPDPDSTVSGHCMEVDSNTLALFDTYEGPIYEREKLSIFMSQGRESLAHTYLVRPAFRYLLTNQPWDPDQFVRDHLGNFLKFT